MLIVPQTPVGWVQRSVTHRFARPTPRRRLRRRTFNLAPKRAVIWSSIGDLLVRMGRESLPKDANGQTDFSPVAPEHESWNLFDAAVRAHRVANKLAPGVAMFEKALALNTVGVALRTKKQFRAALSNCREAVRLAPDTASTWSNLGNVLKDLKYIQWGFR
jgi:tetratricopeptide (TPR) repeat protein